MGDKSFPTCSKCSTELKGPVSQSRGMCKMHWHHFKPSAVAKREAKRLDNERIRNDNLAFCKTCGKALTQQKSKARGFCGRHWQLELKKGKSKADAVHCEICGKKLSGEKSKARGMCFKHWRSHTKEGREYAAEKQRQRESKMTKEELKEYWTAKNRNRGRKPKSTNQG